MVQEKTTRQRGPGTSLRLPPVINQLWADTARQMGQNKTATLIEAIRLLAKQEGVAMRSADELEEQGGGNGGDE